MAFKNCAAEWSFVEKLETKTELHLLRKKKFLKIGSPNFKNLDLNVFSSVICVVKV